MMFKSVRENLILKIVSLLVSLFLWLYVWAERYPSTSFTKSVNAEAVREFSPPPEVIVRIRPQPLPIEVKGPKNEVDTIDENEIKAEVDLRGARVGMTQLKITRFRKPSDAPNIEVTPRPTSLRAPWMGRKANPTPRCSSPIAGDEENAIKISVTARRSA